MKKKMLRRLIELLCQCRCKKHCCKCCCNDDDGKVRVKIKFGPVQLKGFPIMAGLFTLTDEQKVSATVEFTTQAGNPAPVESMAWSVTNPDVLDLVVSDDGKTATVSSKGLGTSQLVLKADPNLDPAVTEEILGVQDFEVVAAKAVNAVIKVGTPELKTPPAPVPVTP